MPTASRYKKYRKDQTTIWVSKDAQGFLARERIADRESSGAVLDRLLKELRWHRRGGLSPMARKIARKQQRRPKLRLVRGRRAS